jgi:hypothetical protein
MEPVSSVLDTERSSVTLIGVEPDGSRLMRNQSMHVEGVILGAAIALWTLVVVGSAFASTVPSSAEPLGEATAVATPTKQATPDVPGDLALADSSASVESPVETSVETPVETSVETSVEGDLDETDSAPPNAPELGASPTRVRVPSDGIRPRIEAVGEVVGQPAGRVLVSVNDIVTLKFHRSEKPQPRQRYVVARRAQFVEHPESGRNMGYVVHVVGTVELVQAFGRFWSGRVVSANDYVSTDDLVLPYSEPIDETPNDESSDLGGRIVAVQDDLALTATAQLVYTDLGADRGVKSGDEFVIIREGLSARRGSSDRVIGMLRVVVTQPGSSSAYITRSSEPIEIGDRLERLASTASTQ